MKEVDVEYISKEDKPKLEFSGVYLTGVKLKILVTKLYGNADNYTFIIDGGRKTGIHSYIYHTFVEVINLILITLILITLI